MKSVMVIKAFFRAVGDYMKNACLSGGMEITRAASEGHPQLWFDGL